MKFNTLIPALLLLAVSSTAHAKTTTFDWTGKVTNPAWRMAIGDMVTGTFEIDDEGAYEPEFSDDDRKAFYAINTTMNAGGHTFRSHGGLNGHPSFDLNVSHYGLVGGNILMTDSVDRNVASFSFFAQTRYGSLDLMAANNLDQSFLYGGFGVEVAGYDVPITSDGAYDGTWANFWGDIASVSKRDEFADAAPTPEPSPMILFGSSLLAFAGVRLSNARNRHARKAP